MYSFATLLRSGTTDYKITYDRFTKVIKCSCKSYRYSTGNRTCKHLHAMRVALQGK